jgi:O-antigen/teichoic acid export membrane protein
VALGLSLRSNFLWVLTGNIVYAACQSGMIIALAKLGSSFMVGQFSLGLAITTPVLMFTNLHLRAVQATDAKRSYMFAEYLRLRIFMTSGALVVIAAIAWLGHQQLDTTRVILAVALAKGIETLSDIHYGLFQLNDRLDQTGRSMMLRGTLSVSVLSVGLYLTRNAFWACVGMSLVWLATLLFFDVRQSRQFIVSGDKFCHTACRTSRRRPHSQGNQIRRLWSLLRLALPLGIVATIASINLNMPRYFVHARMGEHQLGIFSAMAYATVAITLVSDSLGHCAIPRLSRLYSGGRIAEFRALLLKLLAVATAFGLANLAIARALGARLLTIVYNPEYAAHSRVFVLLVLSMAIYGVGGMLNSGILSARHFKIQVPMLALVTGCNALACARWVPVAGLAGAAMAMLLAAVVYFTLAAVVAAFMVLAPEKRATDIRLKYPLAGDLEPSL